MRNKFITIVSYLLIFFNSNLLGNENNNALKIGLLAPLSGEYKELGNSLLYSLQLALNEIDDKNVYIIPQDSGSNNQKKLNDASGLVLERKFFLYYTRLFKINLWDQLFY